MTDVELLEQHRGGSESAFPDLVRRHMGWVYGMARRRLNDSHQAEDVAQAVFVLLHRKAPRFPGDGAMINWLHRAAWFASESAAKDRQRRRQRETEAAILRAQTADAGDEPEWRQLAPILDELIGRLKQSDRELVLLRYFRDMTFAEVGAEAGISPEAARKRVDRAIEQLRRLAAENSITLSPAVLPAILANCIRIPPPAGLMATATVAAIARPGSALTTSSAAIVKGAIIMMSTTKITLAAAAAVIFLLLGGVGVGIEMWINSPPKSALTIPSPPQQPRPISAERILNSQNQTMPFTGVRWKGDTPQVLVKGRWYELVAVDDLPAAQLVGVAKDQFVPNEFQWQFQETLSGILAAMGKPISKVNLQLKTVTDGSAVLLQDVPMLGGNRGLIMFGVPQGDVKTGGRPTFFSDIRWNGLAPQVQVNGETTTWYELLAVDDRPAAMIVDFARKTYGDSWQTHVADNSVDVLAAMGDLVVKSRLELRTLDTHEVVTFLKKVPLGKKDNLAALQQRLADLQKSQQVALDQQKQALAEMKKSATQPATEPVAAPVVVIEPAAGAMVAAAPAGKDEILAAIQKLSDAGSYSWKTTGGAPGLSGMGAEGKFQNDGLTSVTLGLLTTPHEMFPTIIKGDKSAVNTYLGWKIPSELSDGSFRFTHEDRAPREIAEFRLPSAVAKDLAGNVGEFQRVDDGLFAALPPDAAMEFISRPYKSASASEKLLMNVTVANPECSVKFWLRDGVLWKFAYHIKATTTMHILLPEMAQRMGGNSRERTGDSTTLVEIKDVGTTKIDVPAEALARLAP